MNYLTATGLCKAYTDKILLDQADFSLEDQDKVGIIGINGTGKSTLLRILAGLEEADAGEITKGNGIFLRYLPQNPTFPPDVTIFQYVIEANQTEANRWSLEGEAKAMLHRLGFTDFSQKIAHLSGGQKKKAALAAALLSPCEILLLDEPTNHLDGDMVAWLEAYLKGYRHALVMVTHDRYFLDRVCNRIVELDQGKLYSYSTNYTGFLEAKADREARDLATFRKAQSLLKTELEWLHRGARARSTKQKAHIQRVENLMEMKGPKEEGKVDIQTASTRLGRTTLEAQGIAKSLGGRLLFSNFTYVCTGTDRLGIIGPNGCGKTTLVKVLTGQLSPDEGEVIIGQTVKLGYFAQENPVPDEAMRVIDYIRETAEVVQTKEGSLTAGAMLEKFLFNDTLCYSPISRLSGGEKRRLALLKVLMEAPNVLILDEPTNDLDIPTLTVLEAYLQGFSGIILAVSHDRYFLDKVANRLFVFENPPAIRQVEGLYSDYLDGREMAQGEKEQEAAPGAGQKDKPGKQEKPREKKLKFTYSEEKEYATIEEDIEKLEEKLAGVEADTAACATDFVKLNEKMALKAEVEKALEEKMERYVYLSELEEKIKAQR